MVVNRSEYKRRRKDEPDVLQESPKRTKVHAQRKFAQGSSTVASPALTPVKDKVKVNGSAPPAELLPAKRPHTEDFLTFLCFRGSRILPPRLNFFNTASAPESLDDDISSAAGSSRNARQTKNSDQAPSTSDVDRGRNKTKPASAQDRAAKALRKKYLEQRLAKQKKTSLTKLNETVKEERLSKTRSSARATELDQKRKRNARIMAYNKARKAVVPSKPTATAAAAAAAVAASTSKTVVKRTLKQKQMRVGLRSGGQLPPGSDVGLKNPVRRNKIAHPSPSQPSKKESSRNERHEKHPSSPHRRLIKGNNSKQFASSLSDFSSEDEQPLVKKKNTSQTRHQPKARSPTIKERLARSRQQQFSTASNSGVTNRPSRKTKEAAALYMEMLGKDLRSPDEEFDDDEVSVESFPELPNKKKTELREKELKALAEKSHSTREETNTKKAMNPLATTSRAQKVIAKRVLSSKIDERNRRLQLRNKAKGKYLKERKKKESLRKRRVMLLARAAKQRVKSKVYRERSSSELESSSPSKAASPVRGVESRRSSIALKQAAEALKHAAEKLAERSPRRLSSSPEKSPQRFSPEKSLPKKKQQRSPERSSVSKRATNEKKSTNMKSAVEKTQSANQKKAPGKNTPKNSLNESNNPNDKNVKDNHSSTISQKKQPEEKDVIHRKPVEQSNKKASSQNKNSDKELEQSSSRTSSPSKKPTNVSKNSRSSSASKEKKSCASKDEENSDNFSDSDEEPLTKLSRKTNNEEESVPSSKTAASSTKPEANSDKNDSQSKPPKQRKQKSPQKKFIDSGSDKTLSFVGSKIFSTNLNDKKTQPQTSGSSQSETEKSSGSSSKNVPAEKKEGNRNQKNKKSTSDDNFVKPSKDDVTENKKPTNDDNLVKPSKDDVTENKKTTSDDNLVKRSKDDVSENKNVPNDVMKGDKNSPSKDLSSKEGDRKIPRKDSSSDQEDKKILSKDVSSDQGVKSTSSRNASLDKGKTQNSVNITDTAEVSSIKTETPSASSTDSKSSENRLNHQDTANLPENSIELSALSSLNKCDDNNSVTSITKEGKKTNENSQLKVESGKADETSSIVTHFVDTFHGTKSIKIEKSSSFDEFSDKKQINEEPGQCSKRIKLEKSSSFDEAEMNKKLIKEMPKSDKPFKTEKSFILVESAMGKEVSSQSITPQKVEQNLTSDESLVKRKNDPTLNKKSLQIEKPLTSDDSITNMSRPQITNDLPQTKFGANLGSVMTDDRTSNKKTVENLSFQPRKMLATTSVKEKGVPNAIVRSSEKTSQKKITPLFDANKDTHVCKSTNVFEVNRDKPSANLDSSSTAFKHAGIAVPKMKSVSKDVTQGKSIVNRQVSKDNSNLDLDSSSAAFKNSSIAVPKTKPVSKVDITLGKLNTKQSMNPEMKPVAKADVKTILSVPKINLDKSAGRVDKATSKILPSVDIQESSINVSKQVPPLLVEKNISLESTKLGQLTIELNVPKTVDASSSSTTPVKLSHVLPASSPVNPKNTIKPIARPNVSSNEVKKTKSVNDTWRQAFKNAKIPKPGQSSPVMSDEKPFVRKPFTSHALKKQIQFDSKDESPTSSRGDVASTSNNSMNMITPFAVNRKPFAVTSTNPVTPANVATTSTVAVIPVVTVTMSTKNSVVSIPIPAATDDDSTRSQRTIDPDELRLKEAEIVEDIVRMYSDYEGAHKNLLISSAPKTEIKPFAQQMIQQTTTFSTSTTTERGKQIITFTTKVDNQDPPPLPPVIKNTVESTVQIPNKPHPEFSNANNEIVQSMSPAKPASPSVLEGDKPKGPGKHHNLPMPVEQTLKKLQTKSLVTKKPPPLQKSFQDQLLRKQQQQQSNCDKNVSLTSSRTVDSTTSPFVSDFPSSSGLLNKKKVNMSTEEIKKWLNDSTSTGIEHTKDCGIFEKNQCECGPSFGDDKTSPLTSEPSSPLAAEDTHKLGKTSDKKLVPVDTEAGSSKSKKQLLGTNAGSVPLEPEKVVCEPTAIEMKTTGSSFKQLPQLASAKSLELPQKSPVPERKSAFVSSSFISTKTKYVDKTPTKEDNEDKLKLSVESKQDGDRKMKSDAPSPSAQFSPPPALPPSHHQRDETSSNDDSPEKSSSSSVQHERRSIFHQKRSVFRSRPALSRSPSAFSPENESSVYAFEPDLPMTSTPFRRAKGNKEGRTSNATTDDEDAGMSSNSIAVQVNIDSEEVLECSTQTDDDDGDGGHLFYIPIQRNCNSENVVGSGSGQQVIQGVAVKLGTEGPDQRVIMSAKLVTKPRSTFASTTTPRPLISRGESIGVSCKPEQKVKPLTMSTTHTGSKPPVGTVQPTARVTASAQNETTAAAKSQKSAEQTSDGAAPSNAASAPATDAKVTKSTSKTAAKTSVDTVRKIDKEIPAADFDRRKPEDAGAKSSSGAADQGSQCDERSLSSSPAPTPTPTPPPDRRRKAAVTSSFATSSERGRKSTGAVRKQSPAPFLGKKTRKSSPSQKDCAAGSSDGQQAGPSTKAKRAKGKGMGTPDTSGVDVRANLEEAPVFYPTEKEFLDPLEYIEKIRPVAEKYGICKVIPPADFKPECKVSDDMRFTAYNQYVHKMQQRWGANVKEMLAIRRHLATQSITMTQPPWIGGMEVDLPRLYQTVQNCGGLREVMEKKRWTRVADAMRIPKFAQDRVTKLDDIYCKFLLPYDTLSHDERTKLFQSVELEWERRMTKNDYDYEDDEDDDSDSDDSCNLEECIVKGKTMALSAFYRVARNTMAVHFPKNDSPSANEVETEFWNHVATRQNHVCVHSGSIDSGAYGYGFPIVKNSATSKHPWNLKVLTNNSGTILRSLGPLMGVTVPTLHVGMVFTACCWYRDPHGLPWIEYLHTGKSKIWYGIPDASSGAFRAAMMECVPRLCRDKSIWLASDTAMVPPHLLAKRGVQLCRTVQEPGQFIIVFPKAFTSSICTGYLVSESVYFAQPSWLATAHTVFKDINDSSEPSMFSLERLLFSIASDARSHLDVLSQVLPMVEDIKESELNQRFELEKLGLTQTERILLSKARGKSRLAHDEDGDYECDTCRANLFLSLVKNTHDDCVYCLKHAIEHLKEKPGDLKHYSLLYTYNGEEFDELIEKIKTRIEQKSQKKQQNKPSAASSSSSKADQH